MKVIKTGSAAEVERKKREESLKMIKEEVEKVKNWTKKFMCGGCDSELEVNVNDLNIIYYDDSNVYDDWDHSVRIGYGVKCPICGMELLCQPKNFQNQVQDMTISSRFYVKIEQNC